MAAITGHDAFADLARYYDAVMAPVDYDHWLLVTRSLAELLPSKNFRHLDAACGTGRLLKHLRQHGWSSCGVDLSPAMLAAGRQDPYAAPAAAADMRALPFRGCFDYVTCLFDSLNFLLTLEDVSRALREIRGVLKDGGIFYFDVVTERMVTDHYEGQKWTEDNGGFTTTWSSVYNRKTNLSETTIRVGTELATTICQRMYDVADVSSAAENAGFDVLAAVDAETWKAPTTKTVRVEFAAVCGATREVRRRFEDIRKRLEELCAG
ncbi:MAG: class I SAM-dependent methyltransferase [Candidatus Hydrogenedentota bacterium]|mgnify:CR=1 FL=1